MCATMPSCYSVLVLHFLILVSLSSWCQELFVLPFAPARLTEAGYLEHYPRPGEGSVGRQSGRWWLPKVSAGQWESEVHDFLLALHPSCLLDHNG